MRVLHIVSSLEEKYGGPSILIPELSIQLSKFQIEVDILTTFLNGEKRAYENKFSNKGVNLKIFKAFTTYRFSLKLFLWLIRNLSNYDCVHIHSLYRFPCDLSLILLFFKKVNVIFSPHGSLDPYLFNKSDHKFIGLIFKKIIHIFINHNLTKVTFHFTTNDEKKVCKLNHLVSKNFIIPPIGVDISKDDLIDKNFLKNLLKIDNQSFLIGYIGRLHPVKNLDSLIKGFLNSYYKINKNIKLVIIGPGEGEYKNYLRNLVNKNKNIFLLGQIPHVLLNKYMGGLDLFALPSYSENFGITIIEALTLKVPVMITNKVNIFKEIQNYNCGKIVKTDPNSISEVLNDLIQNTQKFEEMRKNSTRLIQTKYTWSKIIPKYMKMYKSF